MSRPIRRGLFSVVVFVLLVFGSVFGGADVTSANPQEDVSYHGGPVMHTSTTYALFWLPAGYHFEQNDAQYMNLVTRFLKDVGGSSFYEIMTQYSSALDGQTVANGPILNSSTFGGSTIDTSPYPVAPGTDQPLYRGNFATEVDRVIQQQGWQSGIDTVVFVFLADGVQMCIGDHPANPTNPGDCSFTDSTVAAHFYESSSYGRYGVNIAQMGDPNIVHDTLSGTSVNGDPIADHEISYLSHELFEAVTDPATPIPGSGPGAAWYSGDGFEIGDKCQGDFGNTPETSATIVIGGHPYWVQKEWSNQAHDCVFSAAGAPGGAGPPPTAGLPSYPTSLPSYPTSDTGVATTIAQVPTPVYSPVPPVTTGPVSASGGNLAYHGGAVMHAPTTYAIFWLPAGYHYEVKASDTSYENLVERFLQDVGDTSYYGILTQYSIDGGGRTVSNGPIANSSTFGGAWLDSVPYPRTGTVSDPLLDSDLEAEVRRAMVINHWPSGPDTSIFLFTSTGMQSCRTVQRLICTWPAGGGTQTATNWRSTTAVDNATTQWAYIADLPCPDCIAGSPNGDPIADQTVQQVADQQFAMVTGPPGTGWTDGQGMDMAKKCGSAGVGGDASTIQLHGHPYALRQRWSNSDGACVYSTRFEYAPPTETPVPTVTFTPAPAPTETSTPTVAPESTETVAVADEVPTTTPTLRPRHHRTPCKPGRHRVHGKCTKRKKSG